MPINRSCNRFKFKSLYKMHAEGNACQFFLLSGAFLKFLSIWLCKGFHKTAIFLYDIIMVPSLRFIEVWFLS